jgi:molybdopterin/thiamine biosynthesis adenylyltransferase
LETTLSNSELKRYSRQMLIPGWGEEGQKKLKSAKVVVAGVGGLGCPASAYLAAAGVDRLVIADNEKFDLSNMNRQILGWRKDLGKFKAETAAKKLRELNPEIKIEPVNSKITEANINQLVQDADVVIDAMDNWDTRFVINAACVEKGIPFVHAGVYGLHGQLTTIMPGKGPCLRCILPKTPKETGTIPVAGATAAFFASLQVFEALKLITGIGKPLIGRMLIFDAEDISFTVVDIGKNANCAVCADV